MSRGRGAREKGWVIALGIAVCTIILLLAPFIAKIYYGPPVIQGVKDQVVLYEDEDMKALLEGVTAADKRNRTFPVGVEIYRDQDRVAETCPPGTYRLVYTCPGGIGGAAVPVSGTLIVKPLDREGPVIQGAQDITAEVGASVSYRSGVTVTDNVDQTVRLQVDASQVDLSQPGEYPVSYSAVDSSGNQTTVTVTITVLEPPPAEPPLTEKETEAYERADGILEDIITPGMTQTQKAEAIFQCDYRDKSTSPKI